MADFSEHIWIDPYDGSQTIRPDGIHYVRAALYDTVTAERDAALARAERAEKALEQAIVLANIRIEYRTEHGDPEGGTYDYVCCDSCGTPFMSALADYLKAKEKQ